MVSRSRRGTCYPELPSDKEQRSEAHAAGTEELVLCQQGRSLVGPEMREVELELNDALSGTKETIGTSPSTPSRLEPTASWKTSTTTP